MLYEIIVLSSMVEIGFAMKVRMMLPRGFVFSRLRQPALTASLT